MSNSEETAPTVVEQAETASTAVKETEQAPDTSGEGNREAAKYRRQLRDTEAERDQLVDQVTVHQERVLEVNLETWAKLSYIPGEGQFQPRTPDGQRKPVEEEVRLRHPDDFTRFTGLTASDLVDDDGNYDTARFTQVLADLYVARPELFQVKAKPVPTIGTVPSIEPYLKRDNFVQAFSSRRD